MERREPKERKRITGVGIVKAVTSGDSLIVMGGAARGALLSERQLTISGILAPKIARSNDAKDAEFAFASREYLRHACIGKRVKFFINHTRETRNYADVQLEGGMDLANYVLSGGYATVKVPDQGKIHPEKQQLVDIMEEAKKRKRGMWNTNLSNQVRDVNFSPDPRTLFEEHKGKAIPAIIDSVREGSVFRVQLLGKNLTHQVITLHLAGVVAPRIPKKDSKEASEPFADEARFYSEARLLHRDVKVCILAIDNSRNFIGSILYPRGNIAVNLLENGYGKFVKWSAAFTGNDKKLLAAQTLAQQRRANIWATFDPATVEAPLQEFQATVAKVWSGESITVESLGGAREQKRITLATIKCPRVGGRDMPDEPYAMKAREFVRSKLIGKKVLVLPEYTRKQNNRNGQRTQACTIKFVEGTGRLPNADLAEGLLAEGLATVLRHNIAEPRSRNYNRLLLAEERAIKNRKGMFSQNQTRPIIDYTVRNNSFKKKKKAASTEASEPEAKQPASRAREFLPSLQRGGTITAVVEHVFKSTHFKLYLPSHNSMLTLMLAGVRSPQFQTDAGDNQISNVATRYAAQRLTQRTVRVSIDALDGRDSNFIGSLALNKVNMSIHLASKGYAFVDNFSAGKTKYKSDLVKAEQEAKEAKAGMWENWVKPPTPVVSEDEDEKEKKSDSKKLSKPGDELLNVKVTEINDANNFYIQVVGDKALNVIEYLLHQGSEVVIADLLDHARVLHDFMKFRANEKSDSIKLKALNVLSGYEGDDKYRGVKMRDQAIWVYRLV